MYSSTYSRLFLGHIDQIGADGDSKDDTAKALGFENSCSCLSAIESTIQIHLHNLLPLVWGVVLCCDCCCHARISNDNVQMFEIMGNLLDSCLDVLLV